MKELKCSIRCYSNRRQPDQIRQVQASAHDLARRIQLTGALARAGAGGRRVRVRAHQNLLAHLVDAQGRSAIARAVKPLRQSEHHREEALVSCPRSSICVLYAP